MFLEKHSAFPHDPSEFNNLSLKNFSDQGKTCLGSGEEEGYNISLSRQDLTFSKYTPAAPPGKTVEDSFLSQVS